MGNFDATSTLEIPTGVRSFGGCRRKYNTAAEMSVVIEAYFDMCERKGKPYTTYGLAVALGLSYRGLRELKKHPEFKDVLEYAWNVVIDQVEARIIEGQVNPTGLAFWLKNKADFADKTEVDLTGEIGIFQAVQAARARVQRALISDDNVTPEIARPVAETKVLEMRKQAIAQDAAYAKA